eukprot:s1768_g11.t1
MQDDVDWDYAHIDSEPVDETPDDETPSVGWGEHNIALEENLALETNPALEEPILSQGKSVCIEVVESQDATSEGQVSDQVVPAVGSQDLEASSSEFASPLLPQAAESESHDAVACEPPPSQPRTPSPSPEEECVHAPESTSVVSPPAPEGRKDDDDDVLVFEESGGERSDEDSQARMVQVEACNLDMFHVSGESEGEEKVDFLRRRDQQNAMKEDGPAPKGKGRGRGKGKGKGRGRGKKQQKEEHEDKEAPSKPAGKSRKGKGKGNRKQEGNGKGKREKKSKEDKGCEGKEPQVKDKVSKRKAKAVDEGKEKAAATRGRKPRASKKVKAIPAASSTPEPLPPPVPDVHPAEDVPPVARAEPPVAPAAKPKARPQPNRVSEEIKRKLHPLIKTFEHTYVVPYWSRAAVGLKVRDASGALSQAGLFSCVRVCCPLWRLWCRKSLCYVSLVTEACISCHMYEAKV